jgi:hypothetical protein
MTQATSMLEGIYKQVSGVDFTESFAPVATDTRVRATLCIYL